MTRLSIDASVVLARLRREERPAWVDRAFDDAALGVTTFIAPTLLWIEIGNRLVRRDTSDEQALDAMLRVDAFGIGSVEVERPLRLRALQLARDHRLSMYDATYLAVADATEAPLLTLDRELAQAAESMGLGREGGSARVSEPVVPYGDRPVDRTSMAAIGAALAEMRKEYSL